MSCLDVFSEDISSNDKVTVRLDTKDSVSFCKLVPLSMEAWLTVQYPRLSLSLQLRETSVNRFFRKL
jgi:hypothetical protein